MVSLVSHTITVRSVNDIGKHRFKSIKKRLLYLPPDFITHSRNTNPYLPSTISEIQQKINKNRLLRTDTMTICNSTQ